MPGTVSQFGEYDILGELGRGGMGVVLRARHRRMDRDVAIKILPADALRDQEAIDRFLCEVRAVARLNHPHVVAAYDAGEQQGLHFLVMEYVDGRDLDNILRGHGPLPVEQAVSCVVQAARGLEFAHAKGLVHRDVKPGNLMLSRDGTVKVLDLGLARLDLEQATGRDLTRSGQVMGTLDYMSPEQAADTHSADARSDIYSLGCTLHRLLTGEPVFEAGSLANKIAAHATREVPALRAALGRSRPRWTSPFAKCWPSGRATGSKRWAKSSPT